VTALIKNLSALAIIGLMFGLNLIKKSGFNPFSAIEISAFIISVFIGITSLCLLMRNRFNQSEAIAILLVMLVLTSSAIMSFTASNAALGYAAYVLHFKYLFLFFFLVIFFRSSENSGIFFIGLFGITILVTILGFYRDGFSLMQYFTIYSSGRFGGLLNNPNMNGTFIYVSWIFSLLVFQRFLSRKGITIFLFHSITFLLPLILTGSRRALLIFFLSNCYLILIRIGVFGKFVMSICLCALAGGYIILDAFSYRAGSTNARLDEYQVLFDQFDISSVIFGIGVGMLGPASSFSGEIAFYRIHNYYFQLLADYGVFILALSLLMFTFPLLIKHVGLNNEQLLTRQVVKCGLIGLLISGIFGMTPATFPLNIFAIIFMGFLISRSRV
jgi:hypothetical protein